MLITLNAQLTITETTTIPPFVLVRRYDVERNPWWRFWRPHVLIRRYQDIEFLTDDRPRREYHVH